MPVNRFKNYSPNKPHLVRPGGLKGEVQDLRKDLDDWSIEVSNAIDAGTGGITELTGDVTTAVGTGSQAATVEGLQGNPVSAAVPSVSDVLTWSGTEWAPAAGGGGGGVTSVSASAPLASSGGATPDISISAGTAPGDVLTWDGANWASAAPAVTGITELGGDIIAGPGTGLQNATVAGIEGIPVDATPPTPGQVLGYDGVWWTPTTLPVDTGITELTGDVTAGPGSGSQAATVTAIQGTPVSAVAPSIDGQVLTWNGSAWVPGAPASGGSGGGGQTYFFNNGTAGDAPLPAVGTNELGLVAETPLSSATSAVLPSDGVTFALIAGFVTDLSIPGLLVIPAGIWDLNIWASATGPSLNPNDVLLRARVWKWDGVTATLLSTSSVVPLFDPTQVIQYSCASLLPQTTILATDRIYVTLEATAIANNHTITIDFGDSRPSHVHTTLPSIAGTGLVHVINGVVQSPASAVDLTAGASEISGTLPIGNGGTGLAATPTDGQLLIGQTATNDYALATLTAGTNVTITNGAGTITIDAAGSVSGTIAANEVAFGNGVDSIAGSPQLEWNPSTNTLTVADAGAMPAMQVDAANKTTTLSGDVNPVLVLVDELAAAPFFTATPVTRELVVSDPTIPTNTAVINPTDVAINDGAQTGNVSAGQVRVTDSGTGNTLGLRIPGGVATLASEDGASNPFPLNLVIEELQLNASPGNAGEVLTSNGPGAAPTWQAGGGGSGLGSKVLLCVEGGAYATIQAAINAAVDNDVILVGPKAGGASWGPAVFSPGKRLVVASLLSKWSTQVKVDSITFNANSGLNILLNTVFVRGLFINSSFTALAPGVNFYGSAPARLRLQECFIYNSNAATGTGVVSNNSGSGSSLYIDNCIVQSGASTGIGLDHQQGYTTIRNDSEISRYQYPLQCAAGNVEIVGSVLDGTGIANEVVRVTGGSVTCGYTTIKNTTTNATGANLVNAGAAFGMGDATFSIGTGTGYCVNGVAGSFYLYGNVTYSNSAAAAYNVKVKNTLTALAVTQAFTSSP